MRIKRDCLPAIAVALASLSSGGRTLARAQVPQFEGGVEVVAIDANVVDGKGKPVADVALEEFVVKVDGRPRRVLSARFVELGRATAPDSSQAATAGPGSATTRPLGRRVILVVDRGELGGGAVRTATQAAARLLDQLTPDDRAAIFSVPSGPRVDFTADRAALDKALKKIGPAQETFMGEFNISLTEAMTLVQMPSRSTIMGRECELFLRMGRGYPACVTRVEAEARRMVDDHQRRVEERLNAIEALCQAMIPLDGPKVIVLISGGFTSVMAAGGPDVIHRMRGIATAAAAARISLYSFYLSQRHQATGAWRSREVFTREEDQQMRAEGLETLTGMAGGAMFEVVAGADWAFTRVASEISGHYLLGLEPADEDRDGKPHDIEVKVLRKGVEVRARRQFVMNTSVTPRTRPPASTAVAAAPTPLPLRVATHVLRGAVAGQIRLVVTAQVDGVADATFAIRVLDAAGGQVGNLAQRVNSSELRRVRYEEAILLPPGTYVVKAGASDVDGRRQVIDTRVDAALVRGDGIDASDLLLLGADGDKMRLPASGSIQGDRLGVYLELYPAGDTRPEAIEVTLQLIAPDGTPRVTTVLPARRDAAKGLLYAEGSLPLRTLEPGPYRARALVGVGPSTAVKVERAFDYVGRAAPSDR